jgi:predicted nucleic acid-binding protein
MIVIDASAVLELLLNTTAAPRVAERISRAGETLHAPHLLDVEVGHVLRRYAGTGDLSAAQGEQALADLEQLPLVRYPHNALLRRAWELRQLVTVYDAMYIALAEGLDAPLLTSDSRLARAHGHIARIEVF